MGTKWWVRIWALVCLISKPMLLTIMYSQFSFESQTESIAQGELSYKYVSLTIAGSECGWPRANPSPPKGKNIAIKARSWWWPSWRYVFLAAKFHNIMQTLNCHLKIYLIGNFGIATTQHQLKAEWGKT